VNTHQVEGAVLATTSFIMLSVMALFAPAMVTFDFRVEVDRMQDLKTLPIAASRLVLGQILTPVLILVAGEGLTIGLIGYLVRPGMTLLAGAFLLLVPFNVLLVEIENIGFLLYPTRFVAGPTVDFQTMGRQVLLGLAKLAGAGLVTGVATGAGAAAYLIAGRSWTAAMAAAWAAMAAGAAALVPLLAFVFNRFDVARDTPA
jgi:hypothetical protein